MKLQTSNLKLQGNSKPQDGTLWKASLPVLDLTTPGFSLQNARVCLDASARAYSDAPTVESKDTQVLIETGEDTSGAPVLVIAFRGTTNIVDWITDARFWRMKVGTLEIHHGFWDAWKCVSGLIAAKVESISSGLPAPGILPIVVTGHSLGGALAILCAKELAGRGRPVRAVYTFGQPRVGNAAFALAYNYLRIGGNDLRDLTWRVVNQEDVVPRVPGYLIGYRNVGRQVFFPARPVTGWPMPAMRIDPPLWFKAVSDVLGTYQEWKHGRLALLADHYEAAYSEQLGLRAAASGELQTA